MLPAVMKDCIKYLEQNSFILSSPTEESIRLRSIAAEYTITKLINNKVVAILLTGSSACGYSDIGSDIDLEVLTDSETKPIKKLFLGKPLLI